MKTLCKLIFLISMTSAAIFIEQQCIGFEGQQTSPPVPMRPAAITPPPKPMLENTLKTMTLHTGEENLLPTVQDVIIVTESLNLLQKKKMGESLGFTEKGKVLLQERTLSKKLKKLKEALPALENFRDYLTRMLAYTRRIQPTTKTPQSLRTFLDNLRTIFTMSHDFLEKERSIELYATEAAIQQEITLIMNGIYNNFNQQLLAMMEQTRQELKTVSG